MSIKMKFYTDKFLKKLDKDIDNKLQESSDLLVANIKAETPVISGRLRDSIEGHVDKSDDSLVVGTDVPYAFYVEFGTQHFGPRAFMRKGTRRSLAGIRNIFKRKIN